MFDREEADRAELERVTDALCEELEGVNGVIAMAAVGNVITSLYRTYREDHPEMVRLMREWTAAVLAATILREPQETMQ